MWHTTQGHDEIAERFQRTLDTGRLASTFLFVGPEGVGKRTFALDLAKALLCLESPEHLTAPCGTCDSCRQYAAGTHPDLEQIRRREDRQQLTIDLFLGDKDRRNREGLCHNIALKPSLGTRRIAVIDDADYLTVEAANCLLKTLEEPPPRSIIILVGTTVTKQLPTIRSRTQIIRFAPLSIETLTKLLIDQGHTDDADVAGEAALASDGSMRRATDLVDEDQRRFRRQVFAWLSDANLNPIAAAAELEDFVNDAGKEARLRRDRLRSVFGFATAYFRAALRHAEGASFIADASLQQAVAATQGPTDAGIRCLDRTLKALEEVDRNANQSTLIASWTNDMKRLRG